MKRRLLLFISLIFFLVSLAFGQESEAFYKLPAAYVDGSQRDEGVVRLEHDGKTLNYAPGIGWLEQTGLDQPLFQDDNVFVSGEVLDYLGLNLPRLAGVRSSNSGQVRIVFDIVGLSPQVLERLSTKGQVARGEALELSLPILLLPFSPPQHLYGIELDINLELIHTNIALSGPPMRYEVFSLENPARLVVDATLLGPAPPPTQTASEQSTTQPTESAGLLTPPGSSPEPTAPLVDTATEEAEAAFDRQDAATLRANLPAPSTATERLHPGVTYRRIAYPTSAGTSTVDIVAIAPGYGEFRVVGESFERRTTSQLSSGGLVGINASYFDTRTGRTIGFLEVDNTLLSLPSRNRASIGFGAGTPVIDRVQATLHVRADGRLLYSGELNQERLVVYRSEGEYVGTPYQGALVVQRGRVLANKIGPRQVPVDGFVLVYEPDIRELALVNEGSQLSLEATYSPDAFNRVHYAVEAGPLLVQNGQPAYRPALESFNTQNPNSAVNRRTTRAAVGVKADGTVLFVTATSMTARELVPLFLSLGASDALQMDSGGSSTLYAEGEVLNRAASSQREIATAIVFIPH